MAALTSESVISLAACLILTRRVMALLLMSRYLPASREQPPSSRDIVVSSVSTLSSTVSSSGLQGRTVNVCNVYNPSQFHSERLIRNLVKIFKLWKLDLTLLGL